VESAKEALTTIQNSRVLTLPCGERRLPPGRLLALTPQLDEGGSAGISLVRPDGTREILGWIRGFEKEFAETYWLRTPADIPRGSRLHVTATGRCRIAVTLEWRTRRQRSRTAP
jgi:hypothetical protein